jgi:predicted ATPase
MSRTDLPLRWIELEDPPSGGFPWDLPAVRSLERLSFTTPVTFLVGEGVLLRHLLSREE